MRLGADGSKTSVHRQVRVWGGRRRATVACICRGWRWPLPGRQRPFILTYRWDFREVVLLHLQRVRGRVRPGDGEQKGYDADCKYESIVL